MKKVIVHLGSLLKLNHKLSITAFDAIDPSKRIDWLKLMPQILQLDDEFKMKRIDEAEFRKQLSTLLNIVVSDEVFDAAWNAMLGKDIELTEKLTGFIKELAEKEIGLILVSNSNPIHQKKLDSMRVMGELGVPLYLSYQSGLKHADLYAKIIADNKMDANETGIVLQTIPASALPVIKERDERVLAGIKAWAEKTGLTVIDYDPSDNKNVAEVIIKNMLDQKHQSRMIA